MAGSNPERVVRLLQEVAEELRLYHSGQATHEQVTLQSILNGINELQDGMAQTQQDIADLRTYVTEGFTRIETATSILFESVLPF